MTPLILSLSKDRAAHETEPVEVARVPAFANLKITPSAQTKSAYPLKSAVRARLRREPTFAHQLRHPSQRGSVR
jgi:hypothetical protein